MVDACSNGCVVASNDSCQSMQAPLVAGSHQQGVASLAALATVAVTSALFGVVWRYTIRSPEDAADVQLKVFLDRRHHCCSV
jgi:hypothetical protein